MRARACTGTGGISCQWVGWGIATWRESGPRRSFVFVTRTIGFIPRLGDPDAFATICAPKHRSCATYAMPPPQAMMSRFFLPDMLGWTVLSQLKQELGIPARLRDVGAKPEHLQALVSVAIKDSCHRTNPRPCTEEDFTRLFTEAM